MPKQKKVIKTKGRIRTLSSSKAKVKNCSYYLEWESKYLQYRQTIWRKIDLRKVTDWHVFPVPPVRLKKTTVQFKGVILTQAGKKKDTVYAIEILEDEFATWLYWLLVCLEKHSKAVLSDRKLDSAGLDQFKKGKVKARRDLGQFDRMHELFVNAVEMSDQLPSGTPGIRGGRFKLKEWFAGARDMDLYTGKGAFKKRKIVTFSDDGKRGVKISSWKGPVIVKSAGFIEKHGRTAAAKLIREVRNIAALGDHPNIVQIVDLAATSRRIYLYLEQGGNNLKDEFMKSKSRRPSTRNIVEYSLDLLTGLAHAHSRRIYHLDIKPQNVVLFPNGRLKLIDFDGAFCRPIRTKDEAAERLRGEIGTTGYIPPESWEELPQKGSDLGTALEKRDSYSTGLTILDALVGPSLGLSCNLKWGRHYSPDDGKKKSKWWLDQLEPRTPKMKKGLVKSVVTEAVRMIQVDTTQRPTVTEVLRGLLTTYGNRMAIKKRITEIERGQRKEKMRGGGQALETFKHMLDVVGDIGKDKDGLWKEVGENEKELLDSLTKRLKK